MPELQDRVLASCGRGKIRYYERLAEFANARIFTEVDFVWDAGDRRCAACGSAAPKTLRVIEDRDGNRYLVGSECCLCLRTASGSLWEEVLELGRGFELWADARDPIPHMKPLWRLIETYREQPQ